MKVRTITPVLLGLLLIAGPVFAQTPDDYGTTVQGSYCPTLSTTMQIGSRDSAVSGQVSELQKFLADYYDTNPVELVTGYYGRITQGYVIRFQQEQLLPTFGIAGQLTRAAISRACLNTTTSTAHVSTATSGSTSTISGTAPSCSLRPSTGLTTAGSRVTFTWTSSNATSASWVPDTSGKDNLHVPSGKPKLSGSKALTIDVVGSPTLTLKVTGPGGSATCTANLTVNAATTTSVTSTTTPETISASIDQSSLETGSATPIITGTARGTNVIGVAISNPKLGIEMGLLPQVVNGKWKAQFPSSNTGYSALPAGYYAVAARIAMTETLLDSGMMQVSAPPSCYVASVYAKQVPGFVYSNMFIDVHNLLNGASVPAGATISVTGAESWNNLQFTPVSGTESNGTVTLQSTQTLSDAAVAYIIAHNSTINPISVNGSSISCTPNQKG